MKYFLLLFSLTLCAFTCKKAGEEKKVSETCQGGSLGVKSLETEYGCVNTRYALQFNATENFLVINSQSAFEAAVSGSCVPVIDFNQYTLVIGKKQLSNDNSFIEYNASRDCSTGTVQVNVTIKNNLGLSAPVVTWHCLLPKVADTETVLTNISIE